MAAIKVLYVSQNLPYDQVNNAGAKTVNCYMKHLAADERFDVRYLGLCSAGEIARIDLADYGIRYKVLPVKGKWKVNAARACVDLLGKVFSRERRYLNISLYKRIKAKEGLMLFRNEGFVPDVVALEWTRCVLYAPIVRAVFPDAKLIGSESDVTFLYYRRKRDAAKPGAQRQRWATTYELQKAAEVRALSLCDIALPQSRKDADLLTENGVAAEKCRVLVPYYQNLSGIVRERINHDILFWGAMNRPENSGTALWFIDRVMPLLRDTDVRFVVVGNRPPKELSDRASGRVIVTGFVDKPDSYFQTSLCFVAPLISGAGIKVKVLEAFSSGIPVLTNGIGIEGIPAENGVSYFHCEKPEEYAAGIRRLLDGTVDAAAMARAQAKVIADHFNLEQGKADYTQLFVRLMEDEV